ncbi:hypothetical protein ACS0TY_018478 [Phlomoides rotata]
MSYGEFMLLAKASESEQDNSFVAVVVYAWHKWAGYNHSVSWAVLTLQQLNRFDCGMFTVKYIEFCLLEKMLTLFVLIT